MKLVKQSFEFINQTDFSLVGIKKHIERCARVSYKSEDKITDTSYEKFINMLESREHDRPLEFGTVHLKMSVSDFNKIRSILCINKIHNDQWIKHYYVGDITYITTNYRYYLNILKIFPKVEKFFTEEDNEYYPKRYTVHMILDRGVMDEFRTHVGLSHLAESTRYCNYSKDKFSNEVTFIIPEWLDIEEGHHKYDYSFVDQKWMGPDNTEISYQWLNTNGYAWYPDTDEHLFLKSLSDSEEIYFKLLEQGWTPQQARSVLPLGIKSELISCGFEDAWVNFFYRRDAKDAHPMAQEITKPMHEAFIKRIYR